MQLDPSPVATLIARAACVVRFPACAGSFSCLIGARRAGHPHKNTLALGSGALGPYAKSLNTELVIESHKKTPEESIVHMLRRLECLGFVPVLV